MDLGDDAKRHATADEIRAAIEQLTMEELRRIGRNAEALLFGTEFNAPEELLNEAVRRAIDGANGSRGRRWPLSVEFPAFLTMSMMSIANASVEAPEQSKTDYLEELVPIGMTSNDYAIEQLRSPGVDAVLADTEDAATAEAKAADALKAIENYFANDDQVLIILFRLFDGQRPRRIQEEEGMTKTEYETARTRIRRGLRKLGLSGTTI